MVLNSIDSGSASKQNSTLPNSLDKEEAAVNAQRYARCNMKRHSADVSTTLPKSATV